MNETVGVIQGGWEFIAAAYTIVWGGLSVYGITLILRRKRALREAGSADPTATR